MAKRQTVVKTSRAIDRAPRQRARIVVSDDGPPRVRTLLAPGAGAPEWFRDVLHYMAQRRLNSDGGLEVIPLAQWLAIRGRLRLAAGDTRTPATSYRYAPEDRTHGATTRPVRIIARHRSGDS